MQWLGGIIPALLTPVLGMALIALSAKTQAAPDAGHPLPTGYAAGFSATHPPVTRPAATAPLSDVSPAPQIFGLPQWFVIAVFAVTILVLIFMAVMLVVRARRRRRS